MSEDTHSLYWRCDTPDTKPSADHSAWVLSASSDAGEASNDDEVLVHGWLSDALVVAFWLACCVGLWVIAL